MTWRKLRPATIRRIIHAATDVVLDILTAKHRA